MITVKTLHIACALLSGLGFFARGLGMLADATWLRWRVTRVAPHIVDTMLLGSAVILALRIHQYPFVQGWLTVKLLLVFVYIGLGMLALRPGRPRPVRLLAWLMALSVYGYILAVALTRQPWPPAAWAG